MLCQICKSAQASVHIQEFINGRQIAIHLCAECAQKRMLSGANFNHPRMMEILENLTRNIIANEGKEVPMIGMIDIKGVRASHDEKNDGLKCESCGYSILQYKKNHLLHCEKCYDSFAFQLDREFVLNHRGEFHVGRKPSELTEVKSMREISKRMRQECQIAELRKKLQEVIVREEYEMAAQIKNAIIELEQDINSLPFSDNE